jgi:sec-independent protein translocase protein TatC
MKALRPIGHEDRLSVVDHLDELRSRLIICGVVVAVLFGLSFWQNGALIHALNRALPTNNSAASHSSVAAQAKQATELHRDFEQIVAAASELRSGLAQDSTIPPQAAQGAAALAQAAQRAAGALPRTTATQEKPITIGVGESFTTTLMVVGYFTLLFSLPVLLYQLYAFIIPALNRSEKRVAIPVMLIAPLLFAAGAVFTYFMVLPPAVHFLQGYNSKDFNILVQAKTYYKFEVLLMLGIGLAFQVPLVLLALQKIGIITSRTLTLNWRYAVVLIAVVAAALPGVDPVTMAFETLPLILLYLASIVMLKLVDRRNARRAAQEAAGVTHVGDGLDVT